MSSDKAKELGLNPIARIKETGVGACHPTIMRISPVPAVKSLLDKSSLAINDFELIEANEAFVAQYIGCENELGLKREITNINGSGIGLGHSVGSIGSRTIVTLIHAMKKMAAHWALPRFVGAAVFLKPVQ